MLDVVRTVSMLELVIKNSLVPLKTSRIYRVRGYLE